MNAGQDADPTVFHDDGRTLADFASEILVSCPSCTSTAVVAPGSGGDSTDSSWRSPRRLRCVGCGLDRPQTEPGTLFGAPVDPYFRLPLAMRTVALGRVLWAFNADQLEQMRRFVAADDLHHIAGADHPLSLVEGLPTWFRSPADRGELLTAFSVMAEIAARRR